MDVPERHDQDFARCSAARTPEYALEDWRLAGRPARALVNLPGDAELTDHYAELVGVARIVIEFPAFMDGRGFSHARKLREAGFRGELIAAGDVLPDQWQFLQRCGFSALKDHEIADAASTLPKFSAAYQADTPVEQAVLRWKPALSPLRSS